MSRWILREKRGRNILFHWKFCLFFKSLCFQHPLRTWRNALVSSAVIVKLACWPSQIVSWGLSHSTIRGKMGKKLLSTWKQLLIEMFFFYRPLGCQRKDLIFCTKLVKIHCVPLQVVQWRLSCSIKREKQAQNLFVTGMIAFFFKNLCFQQPLMSERADLITSTITVKTSFVPF